MFLEMTFTFKTRRKCYLLLLYLAAVLVNEATSAAIFTQCPQYCDCHFNENGLQIATCSEGAWNSSNKMSFPNIHILELKSIDSEIECYIPFEEISIPKIFTQLNFFYVRNCSLGFLPSNIFQEFKSLQEIDLSSNNLKKFSPSLFTTNHKLRYVSLKNNPLVIMPRPFLISKSIWEIDLSSCSITDLPITMFQNLTNLKYLTLYDNKLKIINENVLPSGLKTLNLANNLIQNVPIPELVRLKQLKEINLTENPINCTCDLMGFQNYLSGKGLIFVNIILCAYPPKYAGSRLLNVPQYELCDAKAAIDSGSCEYGQVCSNQILPADEGYQADEAEFERDNLLPVENKNDTSSASSSSVEEDFEGSGYEGTDTPENSSGVEKHVNEIENITVTDYSTTMIPKTTVDVVESTNVSTMEIPSEIISLPSSNDSIFDTSFTSNSTPVYDSTTTMKDLNLEKEIRTTNTKYLDVENKSKSTITTEDSNHEKEVLKPDRTSDNVPQGIASLQSTNSDNSVLSMINFSYLIACVAVFLIIVVCLGIYLGQRTTHKNNWKPTDVNPTNGGTEMQDISLLPQRTKSDIVKYNNKYPLEENSEQTIGLMNDTEEATLKSVWQHLEEPIENGTLKNGKLPNGQAGSDVISEPIECTVAKVTTLPDSIPRTPIIRNT